MTLRRWVWDDGGRKFAGFQGETGDCVTRAIAIATNTPYLTVYRELHSRAKAHTRDVLAKLSHDHTKAVVKRIHSRTDSPRNGVARKIYEDYLFGLGWVWIPTMGIGSGCTVHLTREELPDDMIIVRVSRHLTVMCRGVIFDTHDPSRDGKRCVYGYYQKPLIERG